MTSEQLTTREQLWTDIGAVKERVLDLLYGRLARFRSDVVTYNGVKLDLNDDVMTDKIRAAIARGKYEAGEQGLIDTYVDSDDTVIELGGGLGFIAAYTNAQLSDSATHLVLEANPELQQSIERTKALNDADFEFVPKAYHPTEETVMFHLHSHFWSNSTVSGGSSSIEVETTTLDRLCRQYDIDEFALVVDIEGAEVGLLEELSLLESHCRSLIVEFHDTKSEHQSVSEDVRRLRDVLESSAFKRIDGDVTKGVYLNTTL